MIKSHKKKYLLVICIVLITLIGLIIFIKKPSYEKIVDKLKSTSFIMVYDLTSNEVQNKKITNSKTINDLIKILNSSKIDNSEWENLTGDKYRLEFYKKNKEIIAQILINTNHNNPIHIKYKNYDYAIKTKQFELLNDILENYINARLQVVKK